MKVFCAKEVDITLLTQRFRGEQGSNMKTDSTTVKQLPDSERPYEKFLKYGAASLSDAELLAVIIRSGAKGRKSIEVSQDFLGKGGGNLLNLYHISFEEMQRIRGIGRVKAIQLKCIAELSRRISETSYQERIRLDHPQTIADYYMERMRHEKQERLMALFFDIKCHLLGETLLSVGSATAAFVSPREIFLAAVRHEAVQLVLIHNHPSGDATPSAQDDDVTRRVRECGELMEIPLIDHIVVGDRSYYSYHEHRRIL